VMIGGDRAAALLARAELSLPVRCLLRFGSVNGRDRALVIGGQAFTTIIPLMILLAASASRKSPTALADRLARRFHVSGASAESIRVLFERPPGSTGAFTLAGFVVLLFSLLSLTRSMQRAYEAAWRLPPVGVRGTLNGVTAIGLLLSSAIVLSLLASLLHRAPAGSVIAFVLHVLTSTAVWLVLQSLLLSRRVPLRRLLPGSLIAGGGSAFLSLYSALWMPRLIESNAARYGIIGITFAMLTWLIVIGFGIVVVAVVSAELGDAASTDPATAPQKATETAAGTATIDHAAPVDDYGESDSGSVSRG
jgi:membrane protein